jgi:hypothetical protein
MPGSQQHQSSRGVRLNLFVRLFHQHHAYKCATLMCVDFNKALTLIGILNIYSFKVNLATVL